MGDDIEPAMIHQYDLPYDDEHVAHELENEFEVPDKIREEIPGTTNLMTLLINYLKK